MSLTLFAQVRMGQRAVDNTAILQVYGWQEHHRMVCDALGIAHAWDEGFVSQQNSS